MDLIQLCLGVIYFTALTIACPCVNTPRNSKNARLVDNTVLGKLKQLDNFSVALNDEEQDIITVLECLERCIGPCLNGVQGYFEIVSPTNESSHGQSQNHMRKEVKGTFNKVYKQLTEIEEKVTNTKEEIDWEEVEINFSDLEKDIRLVCEKLVEVLHDDVDIADGKREYIRVYEDIYHASSLKVYDSIVNNDHSYKENILQAALKYQDSYTLDFENFVRGLLAIQLRSVVAELAHEQFQGDERLLAAIWEKRFKEIKAKMHTAISNAREEKLTNFKDEVYTFATLRKAPVTFANDVYTSMSQKYWWRSWFIMAYDYGYGSNTYRSFRGNSTYLVYRDYVYSSTYKISYLVMSANKRDLFDASAAQDKIEDKRCKTCGSSTYPARDLRYRLPAHGAGTFVINYPYFKYVVSATPGRYASGHVKYFKGSSVYPLLVFYFG